MLLSPFQRFASFTFAAYSHLYFTAKVTHNWQFVTKMHSELKWKKRRSNLICCLQYSKHLPWCQWIFIIQENITVGGCSRLSDSWYPFDNLLEKFFRKHFYEAVYIELSRDKEWILINIPTEMKITEDETRKSIILT